MKRRIPMQILRRFVGLGLLVLTGQAMTAQTAADRAEAGIGGLVKELALAKNLTLRERGAREELWRREIRQQLFIPNILPPLEPKTWSLFFPVEGIVAERVTYQTADGMLVPAIVYRPERQHTKIPGIVVVNGHGGDKFSWYAFYSGMMFARAGAMIVTYDPIGEGERNIDKRSRAGSHDKIVNTPIRRIGGNGLPA